MHGSHGRLTAALGVILARRQAQHVFLRVALAARCSIADGGQQATAYIGIQGGQADAQEARRIKGG
ncbi:hypothetical protein D3C72_2011890 [compost metagenome]